MSVLFLSTQNVNGCSVFFRRNLVPFHEEKMGQYVNCVMLTSSNLDRNTNYKNTTAPEPLSARTQCRIRNEAVSGNGLTAHPLCRLLELPGRRSSSGFSTNVFTSLPRLSSATVSAPAEGVMPHVPVLPGVARDEHWPFICDYVVRDIAENE